MTAEENHDDESTEKPIEGALDSPLKIGVVIIYTDGAAEPNPGPGGYGVVLMSGKHRKELSGGFAKTTNNRMELMGVIVGLESLTKPCRVLLYSDSKYVVDSVVRGSVQRWAKNNWYRNKTEKAKNADLWARFLDVYQRHQVTFQWVKGHAGVPENERCDVLAVAAAQSYGSPPDEGYLKELRSNGLLPDESDGDPSSISPAASVHLNQQLDVVHKEPGEPCRKCGTPIVKKQSKPKARKAGQTYYYEWYLACPNCSTMYLVEEGKRSL
jgi:ribonuclease HI